MRYPSREHACTDHQLTLGSLAYADLRRSAVLRRTTPSRLALSEAPRRGSTDPAEAVTRRAVLSSVSRPLRPASARRALRATRRRARASRPQAPLVTRAYCRSCSIWTARADDLIHPQAGISAVFACLARFQSGIACLQSGISGVQPSLACVLARVSAILADQSSILVSLCRLQSMVLVIAANGLLFQTVRRRRSTGPTPGHLSMHSNRMLTLSPCSPTSLAYSPTSPKFS